MQKMFGVNGAKGFWCKGFLENLFVVKVVWRGRVCGVEGVWYKGKIVNGGLCKSCLV